MRNTPDNQSVCAYSGYCTDEGKKKKGTRPRQTEGEEGMDREEKKKHKQYRLSHLT